MARIYDGLLTKSEQKNIEDFFMDSKFEWNMIPSTIDQSNREVILDKNIYDDFPVFFHMFYKQGVRSPMFDFVDRILKKFADKTGIIIKELLRIRANLTVLSNAQPGHYTLPHWDTYDDQNRDLDFMVLIYYVLDSDGPTCIFQGHPTYHLSKSIDPVQGRFILFKNQRHAASFPLKNKLRIVINFNFKIFDPSGQFLDGFNQKRDEFLILNS